MGRIPSACKPPHMSLTFPSDFVLQVKGSIDTSNLSVSADAQVYVPIKGWTTIAHIAGSLKTGVSVSVNVLIEPEDNDWAHHKEDTDCPPSFVDFEDVANDTCPNDAGWRRAHRLKKAPGKKRR